MRVALLEQPGPARQYPLHLVDLVTPTPGPEDVLIEVEVCAMCRTDLQIVTGELPPHRSPVVPGHQIVGRVVARGAKAGVDLGTRVGVAWLAHACGSCDQCRSDRENLCRSAVFTGWDRDGGFATHAVADARFAYRLPDNAVPADLAPLLCGGAIGLRSLRVSGVRPGQRLGLFGFGASATVVVQIARHWGCEVYVATRSRREQERALALGAVWAGSYEETVPEPLHAAITFAPSGDVVSRALDAIDRGGTVAINAIHLDRIPEMEYQKLWWERSLRSVANVTRADVQAVLDLAVQVPLTTQHQDYDLGAVGSALLDLEAGRVRGAAVIRPT